MDAQALKELLEFYEAVGVDTALGDAPVNRFVSTAAPKPLIEPAARTVPSTPVAPPVRQPIAPPILTQESQSNQGLEEARQVAAAAKTLDELHQALAAFEGCALKKSARNLVFADGNRNANIMLIGEAPGRDEDAQGLPFVGRSGQLLDKMLAAINLDRTKVYIGNVIYWRPPGNRTPTPEERALCEPFIRRQIALVAPKVIMTLGGSALSTLFATKQGIMRTRGQQLTYQDGDLSIPAIPTLHPAALLRNPANKKLAWRDLLALQILIEQEGAL